MARGSHGIGGGYTVFSGYTVFDRVAIRRCLQPFSTLQPQKIRKHVVGFDRGEVRVADGLADAVGPLAEVGALGLGDGEALCEALGDALALCDAFPEGIAVSVRAPASAVEGVADPDTMGSTVADAPFCGPGPPLFRSATTAPTMTTAAALLKITARRRPLPFWRDPLRRDEDRLSRARRPAGRAFACPGSDGSHTALIAGPWSAAASGPAVGIRSAEPCASKLRLNDTASRRSIASCRGVHAASAF